MSAGGASVFWMASSITWSIVFAGPTEALAFGTAAATTAGPVAVTAAGPSATTDGLRRRGSQEFQKLGYVCFGNFVDCINFLPKGR